MPVAMKLCGRADGVPLPADGQYLKEFDFEANDGIGEITMTPNIADAMHFPDIGAQFEFYKRSPKCRPVRWDGKPNRPLTSTNWEIVHIPEAS